MKKQTAVEWLYSELVNHIDMPLNHREELLDQAKAMDEKNLKDSFLAGAGVGEMFNNENRCYVSDAEKYLNETFKSE